MCGIAGIIGNQSNKQYLIKLLGPISHRGEQKYHNEIFVSNDMAIGAHRLAIVDENGGKQPKYNTDKSVFCVFNGEIYNHHELRNKIGNLSKFSSLSDSEVILHAYLKWGIDFVNYLDGKFAIGIYDYNTKSLLLIRDHMGIKPLYYTKFKDNILFSSEIKSFNFLTNDIDEIKEINPGYTWQNGLVKKYFSLKKFSNITKNEISISDYIPKLKSLLYKAVEKRISKETKAIPFLLSGGIDSAIIIYLANKIHPKVIAYTLASSSTPSSDLIAAKELCKFLNIEHVIVSPKIHEMQEFYLNKGVYVTESFESILVRNVVSYHFVCRQIAKDGFKYCLNGEGADELFGGYDFIREVPKNYQDEMIWHSLEIIHNTYLQMADRASMYATLEARVPYMDKELVDFCLLLPKKARLNDTQNKILLRKSFDNELPQNIIHRKKFGMTQGAGFGVNNSEKSIYYEAVKHHYSNSKELYAQDLNLCKKHMNNIEIDLTSMEEIFNFTQFIKLNYNKLKSSMKRIQLNAQLRKNTYNLNLNSNP